MTVINYNVGKTKFQDGFVLAIGFFDGVHVAHRELFDTAKSIAKKANLPFGIFTFFAEGKIKNASKRIYTTEEKLRLLERCGADVVFITDFDCISGLSPREFVEKTLISDLNTKIACVGYNFRFGNGASGNAENLRVLMKESGRNTLVLDEYKLQNREVSSSMIRQLITEGNMAKAKELLKAPYSILGIVTHGDGRGQQLGLPTANTQFSSVKILPKPGVYKSATVIDNKIYNAVTNIGTCPTFGERNIHAETYIIDYRGDLYSEEIEIFLLDFLREEKLFSDKKELIMQINIDILNSKNKNGDITWQELGLK